MDRSHNVLSPSSRRAAAGQETPQESARHRRVQGPLRTCKKLLVGVPSGRKLEAIKAVKPPLGRAPRRKQCRWCWLFCARCGRKSSLGGVSCDCSCDGGRSWILFTMEAILQLPRCFAHPRAICRQSHTLIAKLVLTHWLGFGQA